ncbi:MerR family transcriptional regulator [Microbispora bryophytorum]|uniref:MerR family transcriptional regulator n=1 Tax=Microbispora bryophytorum TaxID=1460882 RepID=UPI0033F37CD0
MRVWFDMEDSFGLNVDMKSSATIGIGEAAARFGLATHVLRHWESVGLLTPARVAGDRRRYGPGDLFRVAVLERIGPPAPLADAR